MSDEKLTEEQQGALRLIRAFGFPRILWKNVSAKPAWIAVHHEHLAMAEESSPKIDVDELAKMVESIRPTIHRMTSHEFARAVISYLGAQPAKPANHVHTHADRLFVQSTGEQPDCADCGRKKLQGDPCIAKPAEADEVVRSRIEYGRDSAIQLDADLRAECDTALAGFVRLQSEHSDEVAKLRAEAERLQGEMTKVSDALGAATDNENAQVREINELRERAEKAEADVREQLKQNEELGQHCSDSVREMKAERDEARASLRTLDEMYRAVTSGEVKP
jgi:hypothetical protein